MKHIFALLSFFLIAANCYSLSLVDFFQAVVKNDLEEVQKYISKGFNINTKSTELIRLVIPSLPPGAGGNIAKGTTAIQIASGYSESYMVDALLEAKADPNMANDDGDTALMWAIYHRNYLAIYDLIEHKAKVDIRNKYGDTPITGLEQNVSSWDDALDLFIKAGGDINAKNKEGNTLLMIFASDKYNWKVKNIDYLLDSGSDVNLQNVKGETALMLSVKEGINDIVKALIAGNADVNRKSNIGKTALMYAVESGDLYTVKTLLEAKADINIKTKSGDDVLKIAKRLKLMEIVDLLNQYIQQ
jgi:uncharacterized protein